MDELGVLRLLILVSMSAAAGHTELQGVTGARDGCPELHLGRAILKRTTAPEGFRKD